MPNLPDKYHCCGCAACADSCHVGAISIREDEDCFYFPFVDTAKCIDCKRCESNCHILHPESIIRHDRKRIRLFACWTTDGEMIKRSASGGAFAQLATDFLKIPDSVVYGAELLPDSTVHHTFISKLEDLQRLQQSKYQQAVSTGIYKSVVTHLMAGKRVFFSGTPCQIAALYRFLHDKPDKVRLKLYTAEVICHGFPTNYITRLALKLHDAAGIVAYRTKSLGWEDGNRSVYRNSNGEIFEMIDFKDDFLFRSFLTNGNLRESCYICPYARLDRIADISLADFWYLGADRAKYQNFDGTSLVLVNSEKGREIWEQCRDMIKIPTTFEKATRFNQSFYMPQNIYLFKTTPYIHIIRHFPLFAQRFILQNGFTNKFMDRLLSRIQHHLIPYRRWLLQGKEKLQEETRDRELKKISDIADDRPLRIKLVTFAPHPNFGTCLQSYALNTVLRKMGHDVEFIYNCCETKPITFCNRIKILIHGVIPKSILQRRRKRLNAAAQKRCIGGNSSEIEPDVITLPNNRLLRFLSKMPFYNAWWKHHRCVNLQWRKVFKFTYGDGNFKMRRLFAKPDYEAVVEDADLFVTGSDQIWNPYCGGFNPMMFLEFVNGRKKCVAYSSSISRPEIPVSLQERIKVALSKFSHIAVREQKSVELLNNLLCKNNVKLVMDPVCLLTATEWSEFGQRAEIEFDIPEKFIFCYFIGSQRKDVYEKAVTEAKRFTGITDCIFLECYNRDFAFCGGRLYKDAGPYEWVHLLNKASYVCTDSFHATMLSFIFKKDFVHILKHAIEGTNSQNTRMRDVLGRYGLLNKIYDPKGSGEWKCPVDYSRLMPKFSAEIADSKEFLEFELKK